ncbi:MAG: Fic family protein [Brevundimonas sp.]|jgi:Fic family protein|uniref:Fic family protein n=1 Tax=Brevundimonas sp. TaxID=1871086 RepID=UPI0039E6D095
MDAQDKFLRKQANILRLHQLVDATVLGVPQGTPFVFSEALIKRLHGVAMAGLLPSPGEYRQGEVHIQNSAHRCPSWIQVPALMGTAVEWVATNWNERDLIHLASFVLWRLNWVHPFQNGNGRTARASAYMVLCAKYGGLLPPKNSVIEQIQRDKPTYYGALRACDQIFDTSQNVDAAVQPMAQLLTALLTQQIQSNL